MASTETQVAVLNIRGTEVPVSLSTWVRDDGATSSFKAELGGESVSADTLELLRTKLLAKAKQQAVPISIPFALAQKESVYGQRGTFKWRVRTGTITGRHARNGTTLIRWDSGEADALSGGAQVLRPVPPEVAQRIVYLHETLDSATNDLRKIEREYEFSARSAIEDAIKEGTK